MKQRRSLLALLILLMLAIGPFLLRTAHAKQPSQKELDTISELKKAYRKGKLKQFTQLSRSIPRDSLFTPYVDTWLFRLVQSRDKRKKRSKGSKAWPAEDIIPILDRHENTWAVETLRRTWLQQLARDRNWEQFEEQRNKLRYRPDLGVECADMLFSLNQGQYVQENILELLSHDSRLPKTCRVYVRALYDNDVITGDQLNLRVFYLVANKHLTNAQRFIDEYNNDKWGRGVPQKTLRRATFRYNRYLRDVRRGKRINDLSIASALTRLAWKDLNKAVRGLRKTYARHLSAHSKKWLWAHFGYIAGLRWDTKAENYFDKTEGQFLGPKYAEWRVRASLLNNNFKKAGALIDELPSDLHNEDVWRYWRARGHASEQDIDSARQIWAAIAQPYTFYGKLALEELGNSVTTPARPSAPTAKELREMKKNKGLQRALAFYDAGMRYEGFREFNLQSEQMTDRRLMAAATWANDNQLYDRAIAAADRTLEEHDTALRYLMPFRENMIERTAETGVNPAWVYGIIRKESRFISVARSHIGAKGLMQVMPRTARYVARKIGLKGYRPSQINQIDTNLTLGTSYLRMLSEGLDNSPLLASAGYNAGPSRPKRWRKRLGQNRTMEGALFAELIPFDETRDYVKRVMSNTVVYAQLLSTDTVSLKETLGTVRGSK